MSRELTKPDLEQAAQIALEEAKKRGASAAEVGLSQSKGLSVTVRQREVETLEHNNDTGLGITVFFGQSKASSSTSDLSLPAILKRWKPPATSPAIPRPMQRPVWLMPS